MKAIQLFLLQALYKSIFLLTLILIIEFAIFIKKILLNISDWTYLSKLGWYTNRVNGDNQFWSDNPVGEKQADIKYHWLCIYAFLTYTHTHTYTNKTHTYTNKPTHTHTHTHAHTHTYTCTHTNTQTHTHTNIHTHTHTHIYIYIAVKRIYGNKTNVIHKHLKIPSLMLVSSWLSGRILDWCLSQLGFNPSFKNLAALATLKSCDTT